MCVCVCVYDPTTVHAALPMKLQQFCAPTMDGKSRCTCQLYPWERTDNRTDMLVCLPLPKELKEKWVSDTSFVQHTRG